MQHLFFYIVLFLFFFKGLTAQAALPVLPEDFHGYNTESYVAQLEKDDGDNFPNLLQTGGIMFEIGRYFNEKYPNDEIFSEDYEDELIDKLKTFLPNEDNESLRSRLSLLRNCVRIYRVGTKVYDNYIKQRIVPKTYRKVHSKKDYDHEGEFSYIKAPEGEFNKIYNFKKFLSYSDNLDELEAIRKYEQSIAEEMSLIDKIDYMYQKIEWKKLPTYGYTQKNPLLSDLGIGEWQNGKNADARLISPDIYTEEKSKINIGLHLTTRLGFFIIANNIDDERHKPYINIEGSDNIKNYKVLYPVPLQSPVLPFVHKYFGDFIIPLEIELENPQNPLHLQANVELFTCNADMQCNVEHFNPKLELEAKGREFLPNGLENFFNMGMQTVPSDTSQEFKFNKMVVDQDENGQALRLEFKTNQRVRNFKVFVEQIDGYAQFETPLISVRDGIIYARLKQLPATSVNLIDKDFTITAELNGKTSIRLKTKAVKSSIFDSEQKSLSLGIILLAFIGGFILNFMPCVFPVLALKIMSLSRTPPRKRKNIKLALRHTISGILLGFALIILLLCIAKYLGHSLGWGMQFQNMGFLVAMTFVISLFIIILPYLNFDNLYRHTINIPINRLNYGIGLLTVMLATPCTGPYMATAVGFALSGSYIDLVLTLSALAVGMCTPYLLMLFLSKPEDLFPKSGAWLEIVQTVMALLLCATLVWFAFLIWRQTNWQVLILLLSSVVLFMFCFRFYLRLINYLGKILDAEITDKVLNRAKKIASAIMLIIFAVLIFINVHYAQKIYEEKRAINLTERLSGIDKNLILSKLAEGKSVLLEIKADWCITCQYNQLMVLTDLNLEDWRNNYNLELMTVDWTDYNKEVLDFMEKYGRKGLPFYILFTPVIRDGIVLPELFAPDDVTAMLVNSYN